MSLKILVACRNDDRVKDEVFDPSITSTAAVEKTLHEFYCTKRLEED